jgi:hypothetical protein
MVDSLLFLSAYGFIIRTVVEIVRKVFRINGEAAVKTIVVGLSALAVYLLGLDPVALFGMGKIKDAGPMVHFATNVGMLAGAAMGTHDILDLLARRRESR